MSTVTIWFDGGCPLCRQEIALMRRLDWRKRLVVVDASDHTQACPLDRGALLERFHAQDTDGTIVSGAAAFAAMWRVIPVFSPAGHAARLPGVLWVLERAYRAFLRLRPRLQRWVGQPE